MSPTARISEGKQGQWNRDLSWISSISVTRLVRWFVKGGSVSPSCYSGFTLVLPSREKRTKVESPVGSLRECAAHIFAHV